MSTSHTFTELYVACPECGSPMRVPLDSGLVKCDSCDYEVMYNKSIRYNCYLNFRIGDKKHLYRIPGDVIIGRNNRHLLTIQDPITRNREEIPIRVAEVSKKHSRISVSERYEVREIEGKCYIINIPHCTIENINALNGTSVNGTMLNDKLTLENGYKIVLAPNCRQFVEMEYQVTRG
jgi:DNA-directed RNA polymerase subunit M/transcription elongation factor TFIIS